MARSGRCQGKVRARSGQVQGKAKARSRRGQGKVKAMQAQPQPQLQFDGFDTIEINLVFILNRYEVQTLEVARALTHDSFITKLAVILV